MRRENHFPFWDHVFSAAPARRGISGRGGAARHEQASSSTLAIALWPQRLRHRLPLAALLGASFLIAVDTFSRTLLAPQEVPVGVVTALLGGPFFLWLLRTRRVEAMR